MEVPAQTDIPAAMALSVPASEVPSAIAAAKADAELYGADVAAHPAVELSTTTAEKLPEVPSPSSGAGIPGLFLLGGPAAEAEVDPMALDVQSLAPETVQPAADDVEDSKFTVHDFLFAVETPPAPAVEPHVAEEPAPPEPEPAVLDTDMAEPAQKDPVDPAFLAAGEANKADETAEWQLDSSSDSSSSTDSDDSSSDDADDDDEDYPLMDHAQLAKLLMREDGDDDSAHKEGLQGPLKTKNELPDIAPPSVPDIVVTAAMPLSLLGTIEAIVDTLVLIKASVSGAHQVLNEGSLLVLEDRSIFGVVADTLGRVEAPLYTVRFAAPADIPAPVGTDVFYVPQHSDYVFTQALHRLKGSDASNIFDEEVADGEREFSDDEAEAEHKRQRKYARQGQSGSKGGSSGGRGAPSRPETEDLYTPLARPSNLAELMSGPPPNGGGGGGSGGNRERGGHGRGRGRNRARGQRPGRGRDNHDFRKRDREAPYQPRPDAQQQNYPQQQQQQYQPYPPQQQQQQQYPQQQQYSPQQYPQHQQQQQQWSPPIPPQFPPYQQQQNFYHSGPAPQFPPALPQGAHVNPAFLPPPGRNDFTWTPPVPQGPQGVGDTEAALKALQSLVSLRNQMQQPQG